MNDLKSVLKNRKSNRDYEGELDLDLVRECVRVSQRTACSMNAQQISIIMITDQSKLDRISEINWNQPHIKTAGAFLLFAIDNNRQDAVIENETGNHTKIQDDIESIIVGSVDAGLIAQSIELLLQTNGIGTCFIGGVRNNVKEIASLASITGIATPILGMAIGNPVGGIKNNELDIRPRVDFDTFFFEEEYDEDKVRKGAIKYSTDLTAWWAAKGKSEHQSYAQSMSKSYIKTYIPQLFDNLQEIGYLNNYEKKDK